MTEGTQSLLARAVNGRYSSLKDTLTEEKVSSVWDNVAAYVEKQMTQMKGVKIPGLGVFSISQRKIEVGNNKFYITQRPVFNVSEKFAQNHGLQFQKYHVPGSITVLPLNFASLSYESPFDRDTVGRCVQELIRAISKTVAAKRNVELCFSGIGRLTIRQGKIKMKFYKEFINAMDATGKMMDTLMNRPGTADSVISDRASARTYSRNSDIFPRINSNHERKHSATSLRTLTPVVEEETAGQPECPLNGSPNFLQNYPEIETSEKGNIMPDLSNGFAVTQKEIKEPENGLTTEHVSENLLTEGLMADTNCQLTNVSQNSYQEPVVKEPKAKGGSYAGSKVALPISKANGICLLDELTLPACAQRRCRSANLFGRPHNNEVHSSLPPPTPPKLSSLGRLRCSESQLNDPAINYKALTPPGSACGHLSAGQELCYLCHQRAKRNVPVYFTQELKRRQEEEDTLLQQYQAMKDAEETLKDQEHHWARHQDIQKVSAFNLGVAEAIQARKKLKDAEPQRAYIFSRRPLTPSRVPKQEVYLRDLNKQVESNEITRQKMKTDEELFGKLEQMQMAEDLSAQREKHLKHKVESTEAYKTALDAQLRTKPPELPAKVPDGEVFGIHDMNSVKMAEQRYKARSFFQEQQSLVEQRKRDAILTRLAEQQQEEEMLKRANDDLLDERTFKHMVHFESRKQLEEDWGRMTKDKRARELEEHVWSQSSGILVHEQCDRFKKCSQCKRRLQNCGESNIWSESRFIPGTRIML